MGRRGERGRRIKGAVGAGLWVLDGEGGDGLPSKFRFQTSFAFALNILSSSSPSFGLIGGILHDSFFVFLFFLSDAYSPYSPDRYLDHHHS